MRVGAVVIALVAAVSLVLQWMVTSQAMAGAGQPLVLWRLAGYFTIVSNLATAVLLARAAVTGRMAAQTALNLVVTMVMVAVTYHLVLAALWAPVGIAWWADQGLHSAVPLLLLIWWAGWAPKAGLVGRDALYGLIWPLAYGAYALIRGALTGFYPYPFLDVSVLGAAQVAQTLVMMLAVFAALGFALIGIARVIR